MEPSVAEADYERTSHPPRPILSLRVLLVEDHDSTRNAVERLLKRRGHHVISASSVTSALEIAREVQNRRSLQNTSEGKEIQDSSKHLPVIDVSPETEKSV